MRDSILVVTEPAETPSHKGLTDRTTATVVSAVDFSALKANLLDLREDISMLFDAAESDHSFSLTEVSLGVEISAEGGVSLIGTLTAGAKAAVTLTFKRP